MADDNKMPVPKGDKRGVGRLVFGGIILVVVLAFVLANINSVKVGYVFGHYRTPLIFVIIVTFVLGVLFDRILVHLRDRD